MMSEVFPSTGNDVIDTLRDLQFIADSIDDPDLKIAKLRRDIQLTGAVGLCNHNYMVSATDIYAKHPDNSPNELLRFRDFTFVGELGTYGYLLDSGVPVDSLSLNFWHPDVIGIAPEDVDAFKVLTFKIPVLAIEARINAEAV